MNDPQAFHRGLCERKLYILWYTCVVDSVMIMSELVTDGRTDRHTQGHSIYRASIASRCKNHASPISTEWNGTYISVFIRQRRYIDQSIDVVITTPVGVVGFMRDADVCYWLNVALRTSCRALPLPRHQTPATWLSLRREIPLLTLIRKRQHQNSGKKRITNQVRLLSVILIKFATLVGICYLLSLVYGAKSVSFLQRAAMLALQALY